jgi:hypothetical protein
MTTTFAIFNSAGATLGLVLEHVEAGAGDLLFGQRADQRGLVDDRAACGIDEEGRFFIRPNSRAPI